MTKELTQKDTFDESIDMVMQAMFMAMFMVVLLPRMPLAQSAQRYFDSQYYEGRVGSKVVNATDVVQSFVLPSPWVSAYFINDGPDYVMVRVNDEAGDIIYIRPLETITVSRVGARDRIYAVWYWCEAGQTALVRMYGQV